MKELESAFSSLSEDDFKSLKEGMKAVRQSLECDFGPLEEDI